MTRSPFAWVDGEPYLVMTFSPDPADKPASLDQLLAHLRHYTPDSDIVLLRALTPKETTVVRQRLRESEREAWAMVAAHDERRR